MIGIPIQSERIHSVYRIAPAVGVGVLFNTVGLVAAVKIGIICGIENLCKLMVGVAKFLETWTIQFYSFVNPLQFGL